MLRRFFNKLKKDPSHIAFKLKQTIHFLSFSIIPKNAERFEREVKTLAESIKMVQKDRKIPTIELIPPSFLEVDIQFKDKNDRFNKLSSGEKQKVYAMSSLVYHLKNLDSIEGNDGKLDKDDKLIKYENVNVIFDEVELYYHPDMQRRFIKDLLINISKAELKTISSINFIFITHSPFILSDIPDANILYLEISDRKTVQDKKLTETFGGNIHDLLAKSFFLQDDGYMGEYAKDVIKSAWQYMKAINVEKQTKEKFEFTDTRNNIAQEEISNTAIVWTQSKVRSVIDIIGEPLIKRSLNTLYSETFLVAESDIDEEITRLNLIKANRRK